MRTSSSINHAGPDEEPTAILLRKSALAAAVGNDPTIGRSGLGGYPGRTVPSGTDAS